MKIRDAFKDAVSLPPWFGYVVRVAVAVAVTLYLAFWFELPTPYSAVTTVFIVANPVRGAIVSKSAWRLFGTVVGAIAAVFQFAVFGQSPILFDLFIAVWVGLCCGASSLLRFFPSYGTVLAGYTVVIVDVGALSAPERSFDVALSRLSVVTLGVVVTGLVFLLSQKARPPVAFERDIRAATVDLAILLRDVLAGEAVDSVRARRRALGQRITGFEQSIVFASADDLEVRRRSTRLRIALTDLLAALADGLQAAVIIRDEAGATSDDFREAATGPMSEALEAIASHANGAGPRARDALRRANEALDGLRETCTTLDTLASAELARLTLERLDNVLADLEEAASARPAPSPRLRQFLDYRGAGRNALRGFLAVSFACLAWYLTYWPSGPTLLAYVVPAAALLSTNPSPGAAAVKFVQGTVIAVVMAVLCQAVILPRLVDFVPVALVLIIFTSPGAALQLSPKWGGAAFAYVVFFNTNLALENAMTFDLPALLANAEAYLVGCVALLLTFRIMLPPDPARAVRLFAQGLGRQGERLAGAGRLPDPRAWENGQLQRIVSIAQRLDAMGSPRRAAVIEDASAGLILGRFVIRLRGIIATDRLSEGARNAARQAIDALRHLCREPMRCAHVVGDAARRVLDEEDTPGRLRLAAQLQITSQLIARHAPFFDRNSELHVLDDRSVQR